MSGAIKMTNRFRPILIITIIVVALDQATKYWAWLTFRGEPTQRLFNDMLRLSYHENPGAFMSMGANLPEIWRTTLFVGLTSVFLLYLLFYLLTEEGFNFTALAFGSMMFAGGVGNLIDRIFFENGVIDFLNVGIGSLRTGIFNVADMAIMVGVFGLLIFGRIAPDDEPNHTEEETNETFESDAQAVVDMATEEVVNESTD